MGSGQETDVRIFNEKLVYQHLIRLNVSLCHRMVKIQHKSFKMVEAVRFFGTREWDFSDDNVRTLLSQMNQTDRESFQIMCKLNWDEYMKDFALGVREFLAKQSPTSLHSCRKTMSRLVSNKIINYTFTNY